jgi:hypothetical protein
MTVTYVSWRGCQQGAWTPSTGAAHPGDGDLAGRALLAGCARVAGHPLRAARGPTRRRGLSEVSTSLRASMETPPEQRGGLYETALTALGPLEVETVARYVTPPRTWLGPVRLAAPVTEFDP